jgi:hypothetical protein
MTWLAKFRANTILCFLQFSTIWQIRVGCLCKKEKKKAAKQASSSGDDSNLTGMN